MHDFLLEAEDELPGQLRKHPPTRETVTESLSWWCNLSRPELNHEAKIRSVPMSASRMGRTIQPTVLPW